MKNKNKTLVVLDSHAIIHRAYHALPSFTNKEGKPTGAVFGLFNMVLRIISDLKPDYIVACFDLPKKTFRHEAYADYKGKRPKSDPELIEQFASSRELLNSLAIPIYEQEGFEADDLIGTIISKTKDLPMDVIIASGDMDTLQLVEKSDRVKVFTLKKGINDTTLLGFKEVVAKFGFTPDLIPDYKGLRGDPSDNIVGIKGIGDKTATDLILKFGSIEKIYQALDKNESKFKDLGFTSRIIELIKSGKEEAQFSKILATIRTDAEIELSFDDNWKQKIDLEKIKDFCDRYDFKNPWITLQKILEISPQKEKEIEVQEDISPEKLEKIKIMAWLMDSEKTDWEVSDILNFTKSKTLIDAEKKLIQDLINTNQIKVWSEIEEPLIPLVKKMQDSGALIDLEYLKSLLDEYAKMINSYEEQIFKMVGKEFNLRSPKQLSEILFIDLGLPTKGIKKNPTGGLSTNEENLDKLLGVHPIIPLLKNHRELQKIVSTYLEVLPSYIKEDGRIHAEFLQAGTSTGRFSSQNPNLQNIPIKSDWGVKIRRAFVAPPGYKLATFDYSQIELRVAGIMSGEKYLEEVFAAGKDIHTAVAQKIFQVNESEVTREMRAKAKTINFGILYGMGVSALQKNLGVNRSEAQQFYNAYFENFSELNNWFEELKQSASLNGYSATLFGRRRYLPGMRSRIPFIKAMAERIAVNAPIQGTATADIIKLAIIHIDKILESQGYDDSKVKLILQIHDELVYEIKDEVLEEAMPIIKKAMERVLKDSYLKLETKIPLVVNGGSGQNWLSGK